PLRNRAECSPGRGDGVRALGQCRPPRAQRPDPLLVDGRAREPYGRARDHRHSFHRGRLRSPAAAGARPQSHQPRRAERAEPGRDHGARGRSVLPLDAEDAGMSALAVRALTVPGRLNGVSFALRHGTLAAVVGPNGSGKSTLLQAAAGLLPAFGDVELDGRTLPRIDVIDRARRLAWVPQEASFQFAFSVREVVAQGRYMWADDGSGVDDALTAFDLRDLADRPVTRLSGGERQRVSLARAVATGARLQLWDEPV